MEKDKKGIKEIEATLQEVGQKIEELIAKGAEAGADVKEEIEKKIDELRSNKTTLEAELKKGKELLQKEFEEKKEEFKNKKKEFEPKLKESKGFFKEGLRQIGMAFKALFKKK
ncbi:hypothetical protein [Algoriphagus hitonicola]|uniref:Uncharacterized protein n=1 Tax=Algoriphagus hitonicola TaxID=435880 RepID=A0A1I2VY22_9BACT|nr:hypothetical protein [Algoriphagus hitonicola]SFG94034.1 hypothetical protein SAMN04487988_11129 [Algoriphagus hitonicola]